MEEDLAPIMEAETSAVVGCTMVAHHQIGVHTRAVEMHHMRIEMFMAVEEIARCEVDTKAHTAETISEDPKVVRKTLTETLTKTITEEIDKTVP